MDAAKATLKQYWGYTTFRPLQEDVIKAVYEKKDVLALMPTGGGKSICFQIPALLNEGTTLVISPLIALMQDQVNSLRKQGIPAAALYTGMSREAIDIVLDNCVYGKTKLLYCSPERLHTNLFRERIKKMTIPLLVIDEAHCISQWGHDFRPAYQHIADIKTLLQPTPTLALTATATPEVKQDIIKTLALQEPLILQKSFARPNLSFAVQKVEDRSLALYKALHTTQGSAIVYAPTRKETRYIAEYLQDKGIPTTFYHAGLTPEERLRRQNRWLQDAIRVIVATNAFGMGINKPNVRLVAHLHFPDTLEAYYQEAGRAGRDDLPAAAIVLYEPSAIETLPTKVDHAHPDVTVLKATYQKLANYYQVAIGSHANVTYPLDLEDFAHTYRLQVSTAYTVLQRLQDAGLIQYNDRLIEPAQVHITQSAQQLYAFQVRNPTYHPLIKALNHAYGTHIFTDLTRFSLKKIAKYLETTEQKIHQQLLTLHELTILTYIPQKKQATLTFLTPRYAADALPISPQKLLHRKQVMQKKAVTVIHYMTHTQRCRMQLLLEYLGETSYDRCDRCDLCRSSSAPSEAATYALCREEIIAILSKGPIPTQTIIDTLATTLAKKDIITTIRQMVSDEEIAYHKSPDHFILKKN